MMRKLGFKTVYNLNWGILYLILIERGRKSEGPFALTRPHRDPDRRGQDHRLIAQAYVALLLLTLVGAPLEKLLVGHTLPLVQTLAGASLTLAGLTLAILSFRALGRNFRIYAAPRRSGTLVTTGIYSQIRHPMYTGVIVALGGYVLLLGSRFFVPVWFAVTLLYLIKAVKEERILAEKFPQYESYRRRTWRFLPYVH
jgi:protein-S-isoprenylcysteine O-methyltransferase Ste14